MEDVQKRIERRINENLIRQREIKEKQLEGQLKTVEMTLTAHQKSHQTLREEYYRSLDENSRLIGKLSDELAVITSRLM
jgi:hypothetical protein